MIRKTKAVVLRSVDYSETSQILHLYSRDGGKIHCIVKGARRRGRGRPGPLDFFTLYEILRLEKRPGSLDLLTAAEAVEDFRGLVAEYDPFCAASYAIDLLGEMTLEGQKQPELFDLLISALATLASGGGVASTVFRFEARTLRILGHAPRLGDCGVCRRPIQGRDAWFSCRDGGAICLRCRARDPRRVRVPSEVLGALARYGEPDVPVKLSRKWVDPLRRVLDDYVRYVLEREPKSMKYMRKAVLRHP